MLKRILLTLLISAVLPAAASAQIALVAYGNSPGSGPGQATNAINTTGATLLVAVCGSNATGSVSDSAGNTWNALPSASNSGYTTIYYAYSHSGGALATSTSHTFTCGLSDGSGGFMAFSGTLTTSAVLDVHSTNTTYTPGSITPTQAGDLVVLGASSNYDYAAGCGTVSGYTNKLNVTDDGSGDNNDMCGWYQIQTTATATNPTAVVTSDTSGTSVLAAFKSAGGGGTAHPETDSDTLTLADSIVKAMSRPRTMADSTTLADSAVGHAAHVRSLSEPLTLLDAVVGGKTKFVVDSESASVLDSLTARAYHSRSLSESLSAVDTLAAGAQHSKQVTDADASSFADSVVRALVRNAGAVEWEVISDSLLVTVTTGHHTVESLAFADTATASKAHSTGHTGAASEYASVADAVSVSVGRARKQNPAIWVFM